MIRIGYIEDFNETWIKIRNEIIKRNCIVFRITLNGYGIIITK